MLIKADLGLATAGAHHRRAARRRLRQGDQRRTRSRPCSPARSRRRSRRSRGRSRSTRREAPFVILVVGVNGTGKTTTIGKLAASFRAEGRNVMLAAGDTFRAAAIEQLKIWGERAGGARRRPRARRRRRRPRLRRAVEAPRPGADVLLIDTAGRLQNKAELMARAREDRPRHPEARSRRAARGAADARRHHRPERAQPGRGFRDQAGVTGLVMTKLDGTARGGILVAIAAKFGLPVHFIGVGEGIDDLEPFSARDFARAIAGLEADGRLRAPPQRSAARRDQSVPQARAGARAARRLLLRQCRASATVSARSTAGSSWTAHASSRSSRLVVC